jgi:hypothetical protein
MSAGAGTTPSAARTRPPPPARSAPATARCAGCAPTSRAIDGALQARRSQRPTLEELGTAIEDSLDQLADSPPERGGLLPLRAGVAAVAAVLGALLAVGHGFALP